MLGIIFFVSVFTTVLYFLFKNQLYWYKKNVRQNFPVPILGDHFKPYLRIEPFFESIIKTYSRFKGERYYGIYQLTTPTLVINDFDLIKTVTVSDFDYFTDRHSMSWNSDSMWTKSLCLSKGQKWKELRSTLIPAFTNCRIKSMFGLVNECAEQFAAYYYTQRSDGVLIETKDSFGRYANDVIAKCAFGVGCNSLKHRNNLFYRMSKEATNSSSYESRIKIGIYFFFPAIYKFFKLRIFSEKAEYFFKSLIKRTLKIREERAMVRPDLLQVLNKAKQSSLNLDINCNYCFHEKDKALHNHSLNFTENDVVSHSLAFLYGGFEIVSTALTFLSYELALNPNVQEKLRKEIRTTWNACRGRLTYSDLSQMKYLDMVICETLRKWPTHLIMERVCVKPYTIQPVRPNETALHLEKGTVIWIPLVGIHRDPNLYTNPEVFDPERFNDTNRNNIIDFSYLAFGRGPRSCIGSILALLEMKVLCFHLLRKFEIVPVGKTVIPLKISKRTFSTYAEGHNWLGLRKLNSH